MDAQIDSSSGKTTHVNIELKHLSAAEKRQLAFKSLGFFWLLSVVSIPLPPIHWVTVPGFFLFGIYKFFQKLREPTHVLPFNGKCPECEKEFPVKEQVAVNPLAFVCPHCRYSLKLEWQEAKATA